MRRRLIVPGMLTRSSVPRDADTPSGPSGEEGSEGGQTPQEWADETAAWAGSIWADRYPTGKDW